MSTEHQVDQQDNNSADFNQNQPEKTNATPFPILIFLGILALIVAATILTSELNPDNRHHDDPNTAHVPYDSPNQDYDNYDHYRNNEYDDVDDEAEESGIEYYSLDYPSVTMYSSDRALQFVASGKIVDQAGDTKIYHYDKYRLSINNNSIHDLSFLNSDQNFTDVKIAKIGNYYMIVLSDGSQCQQQRFAVYDSNGVLIDSSSNIYQSYEDAIVLVVIDIDDSSYEVDASRYCYPQEEEQANDEIAHYTMRLIGDELQKQQ